MAFPDEYLINHSSSEEHFLFDIAEWPSILTIAMYFGWKPLMKSYILYTEFEDEVQIVKEEDAFNLAYALMRAVKLLPDEEIIDPDPLNSFEYRDEKLEAIYYWSGKSQKDIIKRFIQFCMTGEFNII